MSSVSVKPHAVPVTQGQWDQMAGELFGFHPYEVDANGELRKREVKVTYSFQDVLNLHRKQFGWNYGDVGHQ